MQSIEIDLKSLEKDDFLSAMACQPEYAKEGFCLTEFHPPNFKLDGTANRVNFETTEHPYITAWSISLLNDQKEDCGTVVAFHTRFRHTNANAVANTQTDAVQPDVDKEKYENAKLIWRMCSIVRRNSRALLAHMDSELRRIPEDQLQFRIFMPGVRSTTSSMITTAVVHTTD